MYIVKVKNESFHEACNRNLISTVQPSFMVDCILIQNVTNLNNSFILFYLFIEKQNIKLNYSIFFMFGSSSADTPTVLKTPEDE